MTQVLNRKHRPAHVTAVFLMLMVNVASSQDELRWKYSAKQLQPFWQAEVVHRESVLFIRDPKTGEARALLLFPVQRIVSVLNSTGMIEFQQGDDFRFEPGSREILVPVGSRIVTKVPQDLRREPGSQKYKLTHRDGKGEILFAAKLEYHDIQTWVTYTKAANDWSVKMPEFDAAVLPLTIQKLRSRARPSAYATKVAASARADSASIWIFLTQLPGSAKTGSANATAIFSTSTTRSRPKAPTRSRCGFFPRFTTRWAGFGWTIT